MSVELCDEYIREKYQQLVNVVNERFAGAVEGAWPWGLANRPELMDKLDISKEEELTTLRNNGLIDEFRPRCVAFFQAEMKLYHEHAIYLNGGQA